jgi:L-fuconolactonase
MIDAHIHFWDPARLRYAWLDDLPALNRRFTPDDVDVDADVEGFVFVQADCRDDQAWAEVQWVSALAERHRILGIVAYAPLHRDADVTRLAAHPLVVGVRKLLQGEPDALLRSDALVTGVRALAPHGLTFDACVTHEQLPFVTRLAARGPETTIVLDHLGKPDVAGGRLDPWRADLHALAAHPNVVCKLSGLATEADHDAWTPDDLQPYLAHARECFGPERCLFGSDWPVATLATSYGRWAELVVDFLPEALLSGNAVRVYGLRRAATSSQPHSGRDRPDQGDDRPRGAACR